MSWKEYSKKSSKLTIIMIPFVLLVVIFSSIGGYYYAKHELANTVKEQEVKEIENVYNKLIESKEYTKENKIQVSIRNDRNTREIRIENLNYGAIYLVDENNKVLENKVFSNNLNKCIPSFIVVLFLLFSIYLIIDLSWIFLI